MARPTCPRCDLHLFPGDIFAAVTRGIAGDACLRDWDERGEELCYACHTTDGEDEHHDCGRYSSQTVLGLALLMNRVPIAESIVRRTPLSVLKPLRVFLDVELLGKGGLHHVDDETIAENGYRHGILAAVEWVQTRNSDLYVRIHEVVKAKLRWEFVADMLRRERWLFDLLASHTEAENELPSSRSPDRFAFPSPERMKTLAHMR